MSSKYWTFFSSKNTQSKVVCHDLDSSKNLAALLKDTKMSTWLVKESGQSPLSCTEFLEKHDQNIIRIAEENTILTFQPKSKASSNDQRAQERAALSFKVALIKGKKVFNTYTENVSAGGMLLKNKVPEELLLSNCKIVIDSGDNLLRIEFVAKILSTNSHGTRVKFEGEAVEESLDRLQQYIANSKDNPNRKKIKIG